MLKYGKDSIRSRLQQLREICRDLHCERDRYTWTSHPALEGTSCAESEVIWAEVLFLENANISFFSLPKWCRSGICVLKTDTLEKYTTVSKPIQSDSEGGKTNVIDGRKFGNLMKSEQTMNRLNSVVNEIIKYLLSMNDIFFSITIDFNVE